MRKDEYGDKKRKCICLMAEFLLDTDAAPRCEPRLVAKVRVLTD